MAKLLFPGRHLLTTRFQERYLAEVLPRAVKELPLLAPSMQAGRVDEVIFAITSANQSNSRFNPLPLEFRAVAIDRFARDVCRPLGIRWRILPIPHYGPTGRFAEFLMKEIGQATEDEIDVSPGNAIVLSSTPDVIAQFQAMGYGILPAELASVKPPRYAARTPVQILQSAMAAADPLADEGLRAELSTSTVALWQDFPDALRRLQRLYRDPILTEQGSLTEMRNYSTYAQGMNERAILEIKYQDIRRAIVPGRIVDEGCADGALLVPVARDFPDSDLMGIEITGEFLARCHERQRVLEFGGTFIHFHQRNIMESIFHADSIDTTICNSTTHELWSYGNQETTLRTYLAEKFRQLRRGGRLVIRDVVGAEDKEREVLLWCEDTDGNNADIHRACRTTAELEAHLRGLSTAARFQRFAVDFLADQRASGRRGTQTQLRYAEEVRGGRTYFRVRLQDAMEFLMKKDYLDNWRSELNEEFSFWSFSRWKQVLHDAGFTIDTGEDPPLSRAYASEWIVKNRFAGKVELFEASGDAPIAWPVTNMVLVGRK